MLEEALTTKILFFLNCPLSCVMSLCFVSPRRYGNGDQEGIGRKDRGCVGRSRVGQERDGRERERRESDGRERKGRDCKGLE